MNASGSNMLELDLVWQRIVLVVSFLWWVAEVSSGGCGRDIVASALW